MQKKRASVASDAKKRTERSEVRHKYIKYIQIRYIGRGKTEEPAKYNKNTSAQGQQKAYKRIKNQQAEVWKKMEIQTDEPMAHLRIILVLEIRLRKSQNSNDFRHLAEVRKIEV